MVAKKIKVENLIEILSGSFFMLNLLKVYF